MTAADCPDLAARALLLERSGKGAQPSMQSPSLFPVPNVLAPLRPGIYLVLPKPPGQHAALGCIAPSAQFLTPSPYRLR